MSNILIVGGDPATRLFLRSVCASKGWSSAEAVDSTAIGHALRDHVIDLMIVVATGAGNDLLGLIARWRQVVRLAPVVVVVPVADRARRRRAFTFAAVDVIGVPADPRVTAARLKAVLRHAHDGVDAPPQAAVHSSVSVPVGVVQGSCR